MMNLPFQYLVFVSMLFINLPSFSQKKWSLDDCIQFAIEHNLQVEQLEHNSWINEISLKQAKAMRWPNLNANVNAGRNWGRTFDQINLRQVEGAYTTANIGIGLNLPVFNGFTVKNSIRRSRLLAASGRLDVVALEEELSIVIAQNFLLILQLQEQLKNSKHQFESTREQLKNTRLKYEQGLLAEYTVFQMEAQLAREEWNVLQLSNQLKLAKITLMQLMNLELSDDFDILVPVLGQQAEGAVPTESVADIYQTSLAIRPAIRNAALKTESAVLGVRIAQGNLLPSLNVAASLNSNYSSATRQLHYIHSTRESVIGYLESDHSQLVMTYENILVPEITDYSLRQQIDDNFRPYLGLSLSIPIFANKVYATQVDIAKVNSEVARLQEREIKNELRKEIEQANADLENATTQLKASKAQWEFSKKVFENAQFAYESGLISASDFFIEKNNYLNAEETLVSAKYQYLFSRMILDFYRGKPLGVY